MTLLLAVLTALKLPRTFYLLLKDFTIYEIIFSNFHGTRFSLATSLPLALQLSRLNLARQLLLVLSLSCPIVQAVEL